MWAEYFRTLLNADEPTEFHDFGSFTPMDEIAINMEPPTTAEVEKAIGQLKRNKAPGLDNIPPEILKDGGVDLKACYFAFARSFGNKRKHQRSGARE